MIARELPPAEVLATWQHLDQRAHDLRAAGMVGSLRELRIQAYLDLLQERDSRLAPVGPATGQASRQDGPRGGGTDRPPDRGSGPAGNDDPGPRPGGNGGLGGTGGPGPAPRGGPGGPAWQARQDQGPSVAALINITVPLDTVLGRSATPGEAAGYGILDADDARALVAAACPPRSYADATVSHISDITVCR
jgi:hypothetical protein